MAPELRAILAPQARLVRVRLAAARRLVDACADALEIGVREEQDPRALADYLAAPVSEDPLEARARQCEAPLFEHRDTVRGGGEDRVLPVEGLRQLARALRHLGLESARRIQQHHAHALLRL